MYVFTKEASEHLRRKPGGGEETGADEFRLKRGGDKELVKVGLGAGWLAPWTAQAEFESGALGSLPSVPRQLQYRWGVANLRGRRLALAEETFVGRCDSVTEVLGLNTPQVLAAALCGK